MKFLSDTRNTAFSRRTWRSFSSRGRASSSQRSGALTLSEASGMFRLQFWVKGTDFINSHFITDVLCFTSPHIISRWVRWAASGSRCIRARWRPKSVLAYKPAPWRPQHSFLWLCCGEPGVQGCESAWLTPSSAASLGCSKRRCCMQ